MDSTTNLRDERMSFYRLFLRCGAFVLVFFVISLLSVLLTSLILYNTENPTSKVHVAGYISLYLSVFLSSFIMTRLNGEKWLFGGLILGAIIFALTFLLSIFIKNGEQNFVLRLAIILVSLFSAFLGRRREGKKPKSKRPHYAK